MKNFFRVLLLCYLICCSFVTLLPVVTQAQTTPVLPGTGNTTNVSQIPQYGGVEKSVSDYLCTPQGDGADLIRCVNRLYRFGLAFGGVSLVGMIVLAGYVYFFEGEKGKSQAKGIVSSSLIGIVILATSFIILYTINPQLTQFRPIQAPVFNTSDIPKCEDVGLEVNCLSSTGQVIVSDFDETKPGSGGPGIKGDNSKPGGHQASELACAFQLDTANYVKNITPALFVAIKQICAEVKAKGLNPTISAITNRQHNPGSLHYRGCAVDFAGGDPQYTLHPTGKAVWAAAEKLGLRINPGSDSKQTFHIHVDVGTGNCSAPVVR